MKRLALLCSVLLSIPTLNAFAAEQQIIVYRGKGWTVAAPYKMVCSPVPVLEAKGGRGSIFDDAATMATMLDAAAPIVHAQCPDLAEVLVVSGRTRKLTRLPTSAAAAVAPTRSSAATTAAPPATPPVAPAPPPPSTAEPPASAPARTFPQPSPSRAPLPPETPKAAPAPDDARPAPQPTFSLAGVWIGIYEVYPSYVQMTLQIPGAPNARGEFSAEMRIEGLQARSVPQMGVSTATVRYDPAVRALDIGPTAGAPGRFGPAAPAFHAVYDADRQVFAGYRINAPSDASPYFVLARQGQDGKLFARIKNMPDGVPNRPTGARGFAAGSAPSPDALRAWASQMLTEYPNVQPYQTEFGALYLMARSLFRDEHFRSFFGKNYDELSDAELGAIYRQLESVPAPRANFPEERANGAAKPLARGFWVNVGTYAAPDMMLSVVAMRSISAWMDQTLRRLGELTPATGTFDILSGIEAEERGALGTFWPSERQAFLRRLDDQRARLADPVLTATVNQQIANAGAFTSVGQLQQTLGALNRPQVATAQRAPSDSRPVVSAPVRRAVAAGGDVSSLSAMASENVKQQLRANINSKVSELVDSEARRDAAALSASLASGAGGTDVEKALSRLEDSGKLYRQMTDKYKSFPNQQSVQTLLSDLARQRGAAFPAARSRLEQIAAGAASEAALDTMMSRFLSVPSDQSDRVGIALIAAVESRRREIRVAQQQDQAVRQRAEAAKQDLIRQRTADVAARRRALTQEYRATFPTIEDLYNVLALVPAIAEQVSDSDVSALIDQAQQLGFRLANVDGKLFSDFNTFKNNKGYELMTSRITGKDGGLIYAAEIKFPDAPAKVIELYAAELRAGYRDMRKSTVDLTDGALEIRAKSASFVKSGSTIYSYELKDKTLTVMAMGNFDAAAAIVAERIGSNTLRVDSYSRSTDVELRPGDRIHIKASGSVVLGPFVGSSGPNGINDFPLYRKESRFPLGSLMGRLGDGSWFLVGAETTVTSTGNDILELKINDNDVGNNDGSFDVTYSIESTRR